MRKRRNESGISMIELMIAILILLVGVISIVNMFIRGSLNVVTTGNATQAMNLCKQKLEEVKMQQADYDSLIAYPLPYYYDGTTTIGSCKGTWTITVEGVDEPGGTITDYLKVTASVVWLEATEHQRRLFTYIGDI
ncbi:MAG: prepilin-type N-terminal cleavage/methylation domain-containing protein [Nitrospirota bacterium]